MSDPSAIEQPNRLGVVIDARTAKRYAANSEAVRARLGQRRYTTTPIEALDLYPTKRPNAPITASSVARCWRR